MDVRYDWVPQLLCSRDKIQRVHMTVHEVIDTYAVANYMRQTLDGTYHSLHGTDAEEAHVRSEFVQVEFDSRSSGPMRATVIASTEAHSWAAAQTQTLEASHRIDRSNRPSGSDFSVLIDPVGILPFLTVSSAEQASGGVTVVEATLYQRFRETSSIPPSALTGDAFRLVVDAELGVLRSFASTSAGVPTVTYMVQSVSVDEY
jgi:hypothetical protein